MTLKTSLNSKIGTGAFTVDVEDGVSIAMRDAFHKVVPQTDRVVRTTQNILELLDKHQTKGTFFILGEVAQDFPKLITEIADLGHEIGVHGYHHLQFFRMTPTKAKEELSSAKKLIEDITGNEVKGHRAPAFSIIPKTAWGLEVISEVGFQYDSSIIPIKSSRYGWAGFPKDIVTMTLESGKSIIEVPISTVNYFGKSVPFSGGSYMRLFPKWFIQSIFEKQSKNRPIIHYMHPYELDTTPYPTYYFEELKKSTLLKELKMRSNWINRGSVYDKLDTILNRHSFTTLHNIIEKANENQSISSLNIKDCF